MNLLKHLMGLGTVNQSFPIRGVILRSLYMILKMEWLSWCYTTFCFWLLHSHRQASTLTLCDKGHRMYAIIFSEMCWFQPAFMNMLEYLEMTYGLGNCHHSIFFRRDVILRNSNTTRKHKSRMAFTLNCSFSCIQLCRLSCWNTLDVCKFRKKFICKLQNVEFLCVPIPPFLWQHLKKQRTQVF